MSEMIFIGTDSGAAASKVSAVRENGEAVSTKLLQRPTNSENGRIAVISGRIESITEFLGHQPPFPRYLDRPPALPTAFTPGTHAIKLIVKGTKQAASKDTHVVIDVFDVQPGPATP